MKHVIEITDLGNDRSSWECDCGAGGSCNSFDVDINAEKHIPDGEGASYRYPAKGWRP